MPITVHLSISVYSISTFLNATRVAGEAFVVNVTQFISDNDRIIDEIDTLIAGLADIHSRINRVWQRILMKEYVQNIRRLYALV